VVTEGEKAADAATRLLKGFVAITSPNGSKSAARADWSPLQGRRMIVWPDADPAGMEYARAVSRLAVAAGASSIAIAMPPSGVPDGWDANDALADGWTQERAAEFIAAAQSVDSLAINGDAGIAGGPAPASSGDRRRTPQRDTLIGLTEVVELWHDANRVAYASFPVVAHVEHWPVRSRDFRMWLASQYYHETGAAIGGQALEDGLRILEARAIHDGARYEPHIRVGRTGDTLWLDLCDACWRAVEITAQGWRVVDKPAVKLIRSPAMRALPEPETGGMIENLRSFVNVRSDDDFILTVAWLVAALRDHGPYPILVGNGEQGSGKSVFSRLVRSLVDPSSAPIRAVPRDDRDLIVSAANSHVLAYDNLSSVPNWLSDALCRLATGGGFATRMLHTDRDEMIFEAQRPIILNGIPSLTDRADLADRALTIHLATIPETERRPEDELWRDFETQRPLIIGALLDAVSAALRHLPNVRLERSPRMADLVKWITAASPGLGWQPGAFSAAYSANRRNVSDSVFEANPVAVAIRDFMLAEHPHDRWIGTATELLDAISRQASDAVKRSRLWPFTAQGLGNQLDRIAPLLRAKGFEVERKKSGDRHIILIPPNAVVPF
jgi:hypothetical protein